MTMSIPNFTGAQLEALAKVFGENFTGSELGRLLKAASLDDPDPFGTKRRRLLAIFQANQARHRIGNHVGAFIQCAMEPARWHGNPAGLESARSQANEVLALAGFCVGEFTQTYSGSAERSSFRRTTFMLCWKPHRA
jgi:hypothetical protein